MTSINSSSTSSTNLFAPPASVAFHLSDYENMHTAVLRMAELDLEGSRYWGELARLLERQLEHEQYLNTK